MLNHISIRNVALIEKLDMDFYDGFSVLTGETGAGKSIIIEALNFVLGERASRDLILSGAQKASVEATFLLEESDPACAVLEQLSLEPEDGTLVLSRDFSIAGKSVCRANGVLINSASLKEIGDSLVDIHGQHAHQALLNPKMHIRMLDEYAGDAIQPLKQRVYVSYREMKDALSRLSSAEMDERDRERRCDLLSYQIKEIDSAALTEGEEETLLAQRGLMQNAQTIMEQLSTAAEALSGETGAASTVVQAMRALQRIAPFHKDYQEASDQLSDAGYMIEDVASRVRILQSDFTFDPDQLDRIEWRLETISSLKRKYGASIAEILQYREKISEEYELLITSEERRQALSDAYHAAEQRYRAFAAELTKRREESAKRLSERLLPELADLGMPHAKFFVAIEPLPEAGGSANGSDSIEFLLSTNKGEPVKPLSRVASGGEISRIMLGFKSVLSTGGANTMVFDEIDSGISGKIGNSVAEKMRQIAARHQVLCITHLPQIAAHAHRQYLVYKASDDIRTRSTARLLSDEERVEEIARIMGGGPNDTIARQHARQLIEAVR